MRLTTGIVLLASMFVALGCESQETMNQRSEYQAAADSTVNTPKAPVATNTTTTTASEDPQQDANSDAVTPPQDYFTTLGIEVAAAIEASKNNQEEIPRMLYINFEGADLTRGFSRGKSFILCKKEATLPPSELTTLEKQQIVEQVQHYYAIINTKLIVTGEKPVADSYTTIHVGGTYADLGCKEDVNLLGIAPFDLTDLNHNDTGFAFTGYVTGTSEQRVYAISTTVAHEAGHTFGLEHVNNPRDLMNAYSQPETDGFLKSEIKGKYLTRTQDEPAMLRKQLGELLP